MVGLPAFGSSTYGNPSTSLFGNPSGLFGQSSNNQNGFNFGNGNISSNVFNQTQPQSSFRTAFSNANTFRSGKYNSVPQANTGPIFGQTSTATGGNSNFFGLPSLKYETGGQELLGTTIKFSPITESNTLVQNHCSYPITIRFMSITTMKEYVTKSFDELRFEDYQENRKGPEQSTSTRNNLFNCTPTTTTNSFAFNPKSTLLERSGGFRQNISAFGQIQPLISFDMKNTFGVPTTSPSSPHLTFSKPFAPTIQTVDPFSTPINTFRTGNLFGANNSFESQINVVKPNSTNQNKQSFSVFGTNPTIIGFGAFGQKKHVFEESKVTTNSFTFPSIVQAQPVPVISVTTDGKSQQQSLPFSNNIPSTYGMAQPTSSGFLGGLATGQNSTSVNLSQKTAANFANPQNPLIQGFTRFQLPENSVRQLPLFPTSSSNIYEQIMATSKIYPELPISKNDLKSTMNKTRVTHPLFIQKVLDDNLKVSPQSSKNISVNLRSALPKYKRVFFKNIHEADSHDDTLEEDIFLNLRPRNPRRLFIKKCQRVQMPSEILDSINKDGCSCDDKISCICRMEKKDQEAEDGNAQQDENKNEEETDKIISTDKNKSSLDHSTDGFESNPEGADLNNNQCIIKNSTELKKAGEHPTGIICTRDDYYTEPSLDELATKIQPDGRVMVDNFTIGRKGYGSVYFPERFNVAGINIDRDVHFNLKEIVIYEDEENKPPLGEQLNRPAIVTLEKVFPRDQNSGELIIDKKRLEEMNFEKILSDICQRDNTNFIKYIPESGSWIFQVHHF